MWPSWVNEFDTHESASLLTNYNFRESIKKVCDHATRCDWTSQSGLKHSSFGARGPAGRSRFTVPSGAPPPWVLWFHRQLKFLFSQLKKYRLKKS